MDYKKIFDDNLETLRSLLKINSIYDEKTVDDENPYGKGCKEALDFMKDLAIKDGFIVKDYDNKAISISYVDNEDERIDVVSHLDVVSVDDKWSYDPFGAVIKDGKLYGRGSEDMKTAAFLSYLVLRELRNKYPDVKREIRVVFGSDEERTMDDMRHYCSLVKKPLFAFSPDGTFPMVIGEKGALMWTISGDYDGVIESLDGGIQCNVVPPYVNCTLKDDRYTEKLREYFLDKKANVTSVNGKTVIHVDGVAVHCSRCFDGVNAINVLLKGLAEVCGDSLCKNLYDILGEDYGEGLDSKVDEVFDTCLTVNLGRLIIKDGELFGQVDARYPATLTSAELTKKFKEKAMFNVSLDYDDPPTLNSLDDPYIKEMLDVYDSVMHDGLKPYVSGGVSYSKVFKHCVTFGMNMPNKENLAHQVDEYVELDDCVKALEIYYKTFERFIEMEI